MPKTALSIVVDRVEYDYPEYTGIPDRIDQRPGLRKVAEIDARNIRAVLCQPVADRLPDAPGRAGNHCDFMLVTPAHWTLQICSRFRGSRERF